MTKERREANPFERIFESPTWEKSGMDYDMREVDIDQTLMLDLFTSEPHRIPLVSFLSSSCGIFGSTGTGKSVSCARIIEQVSDNNIPFTIMDKEGDFDTLIDYNNRIKAYYFAQDIGTEEISFTRKEKFRDEVQVSKSFSVSPDFAEIRVLAKENFLKGRMSVLDLSMMNNRSDIMELVYTYISTVKAFSDELYKQELKLHHILLLDESHYYVPSQWSDFYDKSIKLIKPLIALVSSLGAMARKRGVVIILSSQRMSHISWDTLANVKQFVLHLVNNSKDLERYRTYLSAAPFPISQLDTLLAMMKPGECIYLLGDQVYITRMKMRESRHAGRTPRPSDTKRTLERIKSGEIELPA